VVDFYIASEAVPCLLQCDRLAVAILFEQAHKQHSRALQSRDLPRDLVDHCFVEYVELLCQGITMGRLHRISSSADSTSAGICV
jgi:hypothetical protein